MALALAVRHRTSDGTGSYTIAEAEGVAVGTKVPIKPLTNSPPIDL